MAELGGALVQVHTFHSIMASPNTHRPNIAHHAQYWNQCGKNSRQPLTPTSSTQLIGSKYLRQVIITWSMRSRGSVQRTHIITNTRNQHLKMNTITLMMLPTTGPRKVSLSSG